jgi:hypothetical protein
MQRRNFLTAALYRTDASGRRVIFPRGHRGPGFIVPDSATEQRLNRIVTGPAWAAGGLAGLGMWALMHLYGQVWLWPVEVWIGLAVGWALAIVLGIIVRRRLVAATAGLERSELTTTFVRQLGVAASVWPRWFYWTMVVTGPIMAALFVFVGLRATGAEKYYVLGMSVVMLLAGVQGIVGLQASRKPKS